MAYIGFNAQSVTPASSSFDLLPRGRYLATCIESEMKTNQARTGEYLKLSFEILDGPHKGRRLFDQINVRHQNPKAVEIALGILSQLCHAVNVLDLQDSMQLHNIPVILSVGIEKGRDGFDDRNRIYSYHSTKEEQAPSFAPPANAGYGSPTGTLNPPFSAPNRGLPPLKPPTWGNPTPPIKDDDIPF